MKSRKKSMKNLHIVSVYFSGNGAKRIYRFSLPSVCGEPGAERSKFTMKDYFSFEEQREIAEKLILAISGQKKKYVETNKKCVKKVCKQD